jgi:phosphotransferase system HPr-like phosphotransfer protein
MSAKKPPDDGVITKELTIVNKLGIHARPASRSPTGLPATSSLKRTVKKSTAKASWV